MAVASIKTKGAAATPPPRAATAARASAPAHKNGAAAPSIPVAREQTAQRTPERMPERDPNVILNRRGEPVSLRFTGGEDQFAFDRSIIPEGWDYQWKTKTIKGWEWTQHQVELAANGWEPVPASRHDGMFMPRGFPGNIERGGQILMERDMRLTLQARAIEQRDADAPVINSRSKAGLAAAMQRAAPNSGAIVDFDHSGAQRATGFKKTSEGIGPIASGQRNYTYTLDE